MSMPAALQRRRDYAGPALFAYGFRPFFLAAGIWAEFGLLLWLPQYMGALALPTYFSPLDWHIHEMLYGYVAAAVAGFLLTAIPNWTGRLPVSGWPLAGLALLWLAGRAAIRRVPGRTLRRHRVRRSGPRRSRSSPPAGRGRWSRTPGLSCPAEPQ